MVFWATKILAVVAYVAMVVVNYLAVTLPLAGRDTGAISDKYPNLFVPAGYTFSIWGLLYTLLGAYTVYQLASEKNSLAARINKLFIVNAALNIGWLFSWHHEIMWLSVLIMLGLLFTLIWINGLTQTGASTKPERWLVRLPFSAYFGWITVATIANITAWLVSIKWGGFGLPESLWAILVLLVGAAIGSWRMLRDRSIAYGLVLMWAYGGIVAKHVSERGFAGQYPLVIAFAVLCMVIFAGVVLFIGVKLRTEVVRNVS